MTLTGFQFDLFQGCSWWALCSLGNWAKSIKWWPIPLLNSPTTLSFCRLLTWWAWLWRDLGLSRSFDALDGALHFLGKQAKNIMWWPIQLLNSHQLVFFPTTHLVGITLMGFWFEPFLGHSIWALCFLGKWGKNINWWPIPLLNWDYLVFFLVAHLVGTTLIGFGFEAFLQRSWWGPLLAGKVR